jgi:hypothetical protein
MKPPDARRAVVVTLVNTTIVIPTAAGTGTSSSSALADAVSPGPSVKPLHWIWLPTTATLPRMAPPPVTLTFGPIVKVIVPE